jgi:hypothetical protein
MSSEEKGAALIKYLSITDGFHSAFGLQKFIWM